MALTAQHFVAPLGTLTPEMFPDEDVLARVAGYLQEAAREIALYPAGHTEAYVYWRAYDALYARLLANPTTFDAGSGQGSHSYSAAQIAGILDLANGYKATWIASIEVRPTTSSQRGQTIAVPTEVRW